MKFTENDFLHGDTVLLTDSGLVKVNDLTDKDNIAAVDYTFGLQFIPAVVHSQGRSGLYYNVHTSIGVLKLGMNCFVNHSKNFKDRLPACEFVDLYSNSKMYLTASVDYRHPTEYKDSLPWGEYFGIASSGSARQYGKTIVGVQFFESDNARQVMFSDMAKKMKMNVTIKQAQRGKLYKIPNATNRLSAKISMWAAKRFSREQARDFMRYMSVFDNTARMRADYSKKEFTLLVHDTLLPQVILCGVKAGYNIRMKVDKKNPVKTPVKFYVAKHQTVHVEDAYIAQHEYEDKAILTPDGIAGVIAFVDGNMIILSGQRPLQEI